MKSPVTFAALALISCSLLSCADPHRRELRREKADAKSEAERRDRDRQRDSDDYRFFLRDYARRLGKTVSELSPSERAQAKHEFDAEGGRHYEDYSRPYFWR